MTTDKWLVTVEMVITHKWLVMVEKVCSARVTSLILFF